jgi:hypothetical protein
MSKLYNAVVYLPFTYAARQAAVDAKGSRLAPHEWNAAAVQAQQPAHRAFLEQYGCRTLQLDEEGGWVRFNIGGGWIGQSIADEFCEVFAGCKGRLEDATEQAIKVAIG